MPETPPPQLPPWDFALFQASPNAMILTDREGCIRKANAKAAQIFGLSEVELCQKKVEDFVPQAVRSQHHGYRSDYLAQPSPRAMGEGRYLQVQRLDGLLIPVEISLCPLELNGETCVVATIVDISLQRRQAEELNRFNTALEQLVAEKSAQLEATRQEFETFIYTVSHDLRAPLRAINGFSQALKEDFSAHLPGEGQFFLEQIAVANQRMSDLIDGLLGLSRIWRQTLVWELVDVSSLARKILTELEAGQPDRQVAWEVAPGLRIPGDAKLLNIALLNLLENAWKYTAQTREACITVGIETRAGKKWVTVADNGAGFNPKYRGNLFKPFQRLHREDEFPGLGIGLATVKKIFDLLGCELEAEGQEQKGARFSFSVPPPREGL